MLRMVGNTGILCIHVHVIHHLQSLTYQIAQYDFMYQTRPIGLYVPEKTTRALRTRQGQ